MKNYFKHFFLIIGVLSITVYANDISINFEGLQNMEEIKDYYNGGQGSKGSIGPDYNITFTGTSLAIIDSDNDGGIGNFAHEPSPNTVVFFLDSDNLTMNAEQGFTKGFSFYYSSIDYDGEVVVYDDYNATGKILKILSLPKLGSAGKGDPNGDYDTWKTVSVSFDGIAKSVSFKGTANRIAFDNITLNPNPPKDVFNIKLSLYDKNGLDAILHKTTAPISNTFRAVFKIEPIKDDEGNDKEDISKVCENYIFKVEENSNRGATQQSCNYIPANGKKPAHVEVDFKIKQNANTYYFENAKLNLCKANEVDNCNELDFVKDFTVYGTGFSITRDAFNFRNGSWNKAEGDIDSKTTKLDFVRATNDLAWATDIIDDYISAYPNRESLWNSVGYKLDIEKEDDWFDWDWTDREKNSQGLCHGMAFSAIANYNHRDDNNAWGIGGEVKKEWKGQINKHWDKTQHKAKSSFRPFNNTTYNYNKNNIEALKKIIYYFVTQSYYSDNPDNNWNGDYPFDTNIENLSSRNKLKNILRNGSPFGMRFLISTGGGHAVVSTQFISYNNIDKWYIYDNNLPNKYIYYKIANNSNYQVAINNKIFYETRTIYPLKNLGARIGKDTSVIYGNLLPSSTKSSSKQQNKMYKTTSSDNSYEYLLPSHIKINMVGGKFKSIIETTNNKDIITVPYMGTFLPNQAYQQNSNIFNNSVYLPVGYIYKISVQKDKDFPMFKLFGKIPNSDGTIEVVHYDNIESDANDSTLATFYIGTNNTNKTLKRDNASDTEPTNDESFKLKLTPVINANTIVLGNKVELSWNNPNNPNLEEIVIVRKENEKPMSPTDGTEIYRAVDETFSDDTISTNAKYFYAIYAVSKDNAYTEAIYQFVDTYKYTLYGTIKDNDNKFIKNVQVKLQTTDKLKTIDITNSDKDGLFSINNLTNGIYTLSFVHPYYIFNTSEINVTINDKSLEVISEAIAKPILSIDMSSVIQVGDSEKISWNGQHISDDSRVNIKAYRNNKWETIVTDIEYSKHSIDWLVTNPKDLNASIKIELSSNTSVFVEKKVHIFGEDDTKYDFDGDGDIDVADIMKVVSGWNSKLGDSSYNASYDFNDDKKIDIKDIMIIASKWGML